MIGKLIRLERIIDRNSGKTVILPMDHGLTMGPIEGLVDMKKIIDEAVEGGANAVILHKGIVISGHRSSGQDIGLIIHLTGSTSLSPAPNAKVAVCSVDEAIKLGADAVSVHINLGDPSEGIMLRHFGEVSRQCQEWGMPLLAMMYTRGDKIKNEFDVKYVKHAARVGAEMGADIVKVNYTGSPESFKEVIEGCPVPVIIAGGEKLETEMDLWKIIEGALLSGASGVSIGRNIFQHKNPSLLIKTIGKMVHKNLSINEAVKMMSSK
ncbi:MAG: 2-amino-3,7-dideoxy-D-threo-hept-6-ulosonate synthase [Candidatus Omnitrophica bacterium]|nr:2-amino-3,7-dideoxy-D-threo-hept-6-ulosonate synthase [Candidatus Omnitrophota bacterium]